MRLKTPTYIQMEASECGAVALQIILAYMGKYIAIEDLRIACNVSRDGCNLLNIIEAAKEYDVEAEGYTCELADLNQLRLPVIIHWNFNHFVVLEGFGKNKFYINDPATGPRIVFLEEFNHSFTGPTLVLKPGPQFKKSGKPYRLWKNLWQRVESYRVSLLFPVLTGFLLVIPTLGTAAFAKFFVDNMDARQYAMLQNKLFFFGMVGLAILTGILTFLQSYVLSRLQTSLSIRLYSEMFWRMLRLPYSFYTQRYPGEIAYRITLNESVSSGFMANVPMLVINAIMALVYGGVIFYYDKILAIAGLLTIFANISLMRVLNRLRQDSYSRYQADISSLNSYTISGLSTIETIKATGSEYKFFNTWAGHFTKSLNSLQDSNKKGLLLQVAPPFLQSLTVIVLLGVGAIGIMDGTLSFGAYVGLQILLRYFTAPVTQLVNFASSIQLFKTDLNRLDDVMSHPLDPLLKENKEGSPQALKCKLSGRVELNQVSFGYSYRDQPVIKEISLNLQPGKAVAIVGPTGSGKSTLVALLTGLFIPWEGQILYDGLPIKQIPRDQFTGSIAVIAQVPFIFSGSIRDNITLNDPSIPIADVIQAAKDACLHDEIIIRKGGYEAMLTEQGANLSAGQKQRLEIARALLKDPSILILDEATNTLDSETEARIFRHIRRRGCALLMIAHRLSTVRHCEEILVFFNGTIVSSGTHEKLAAQPGIYQDLVNIEKIRAAYE